MKFIKYIFKPYKNLAWTLLTFIFLIFGVIISCLEEDLIPLLTGAPFVANLVGDFITFKIDTKSGILK